MKTFDVHINIGVQVVVSLSAENFGDAEAKARKLKAADLIKAKPGVELADWSDLGALAIYEQGEGIYK